MPDRQRYGRLTPAAVPDFLAMVAGNEIYLPGYKGNPAFDELGQSAEAAVRRWADGRCSIERIAIGNVDMHSDDVATVQVHLDAERLSIQAQRQAFPIYGNCRDMDGPPKDKLRWVAWVER